MSDYHAGSTARVSIAFTDAAGTPGDPSTVTLTVKDPAGTIATYTFGQPGAVTITHDDVGAFHADVPLNTPGTWHYAWQGDQPGVSDEGVLNVLQPGTAAVRPLVTDLRRLVAAGTTEYTIGDETYWTDEQLDAVLDRHVSGRLIQVPIDLLPSFDGNGQLQFVDGRIPVNGALDPATVVVVAFNGVPIPGSFTAQRDGRISFTETQVSAVPVASGLAYDLNAAAAEVLETWASAVKLGYDITTDGQQMSRSQRHKQLLEQAKTYRGRALISVVDLCRNDYSPRGGRIVQGILKAWPYLGQGGTH